MNAVIYARYSSHNQREESIEGQLRKCRLFAEQHDFTIIGEYIDRALSGKTDKREEFQRLIRDSEKGKFQAVIMYTLDRFARNRYDSAHYKAKLKKNGVRIYYTEQTITDEPEGIILESVLEGMAEYYSENLARGVRRGMRENALQCKTTGGTMLLGYRRSAEGKYEIDPAKAPIVKEIFDLYVNGKTQRQIIDILNEKGYRNNRGAPFKFSALQGLLTNRKYIGIFEYKDIVIENGVPPIIDKKTFDTVQKKLKENRRTTGRAKAPERYLLTTKLFCGHCGAAMIGESGTSRNGKIHNYYKCYERKKNKQCDKLPEKKQWIEKFVVEKTIEEILKPNVIPKIAENVARITQERNSDVSRLNSLQKEMKQLNTSIRRILDLVEKGIATDDITQRLLELDSEKTNLQKEIDAAEIKLPSISKEKIEFWLTDFLSNGSPDDPEYQQRIIDTLVHKVFVYDTDNGGKRIVITYNTSSNITTEVTLSDIPMQAECSDIVGQGVPSQSNPNIFYLPNHFGLIINVFCR